MYDLIKNINLLLKFLCQYEVKKEYLPLIDSMKLALATFTFAIIGNNVTDLKTELIIGFVSTDFISECDLFNKESINNRFKSSVSDANKQF